MKPLFLIFLCVTLPGWAQDPSRFANQVSEIQQKYDTLLDTSKETIVFTGSSSVRMWKSLDSMFPEHQIVNSGFGGSQASDLLVYSEELITDFNPKKVFIYEGDNDVNAKKKSREIIKTFEDIIAKVKAQDDQTEIVIIAAKPSISRWKLKRKYKRLNRKLERLAKKNDLLEFADVWTPMLDGRTVKQDIFIEDGLHMNAKGYALWYDVIKPYMKTP